MVVATSVQEVQERYEAFIMPLVRARLLRKWPKDFAELRDDALQEALALAWVDVLRDWRRNVDSVPFARRIAKRAVASAMRGDSVVPGRRRYDPMRERDRASKSSRPTRLPLRDLGHAGAHLRKHVSSTFAKAAFRVDLATFLALLPGAHQVWAELLAQGYTGPEVAKRVGLSENRLNDWRRIWRRLWVALHQGEALPLTYSVHHSHRAAK